MTTKDIPRHNFVKAKSLFFLSERLRASLVGEAPHAGYVSGPEIAELLAEKPDSLRKLLKRWAAWGWLRVHTFSPLCMSNGRERRYYRITPKGQRRLHAMPRWYPFLRQAQAEAAEAQERYYYRATVREVVFPAFPGVEVASRLSQMALVCLVWPFQSALDVHPASTRSPASDYFRCEGVREASIMCQAIFHQAPSESCLNEALRWCRSIAREHGLRLVEPREKRPEPPAVFGFEEMWQQLEQEGKA